MFTFNHTWENITPHNCKLSALESNIILIDGKGDKNKRDILISDYDQGGLKMIDIRLRYPSTEIKLVGNNAKWKLLLIYN